MWGNNLQLALQEQFLFRSRLGVRWSKIASSTQKRKKKKKKSSPKYIAWGCFLLSAMAQPLPLCEYSRALVTSSARGEKEPLSLPHAPAFCHSFFNVCGSEGLVVMYPRFDIFISSPPPTSYSLGRVARISTLAHWDLSSTRVKSGQSATAKQLMLKKGEGVVRSNVWSALYKRHFLLLLFKIQVGGERGPRFKWWLFSRSLFYHVRRWMTVAQHPGLDAKHGQKRAVRIRSHPSPPFRLPPGTDLLHA